MLSGNFKAGWSFDGAAVDGASLFANFCWNWGTRIFARICNSLGCTLRVCGSTRKISSLDPNFFLKWREALSCTESSSVLNSALNPCGSAPGTTAVELLLISLKQSEKSALPAARTISHERHNVAKHVWNSYPLLHLWPAKTTVWQLANEACAGWSGRPCVAHDSEGHSRHQMGQDGVFRRKWLKLLKANTVSSCGHASILHIRTALLFSLLICLSGFSNQRGFWRSFYFYMRAMKVYIKIQLPKWARMWLLRVKF